MAALRTSRSLPVFSTFQGHEAALEKCRNCCGSGMQLDDCCPYDESEFCLEVSPECIKCPTCGGKGVVLTTKTSVTEAPTSSSVPVAVTTADSKCSTSVSYDANLGAILFEDAVPFMQFQ